MAVDGNGTANLAAPYTSPYTTYTYDADGNLLHLVNYASGTTVNSRFDYTYNALGQVATMATVDGTWTDPTGGRVYRVGRNNSLDAVFKELSDEMRSQYAIGYTPLNPAKDGSFRKLEIRMANKDLKAQARKGYYALKPETH